jgi:hypothetical protein
MLDDCEVDSGAEVLRMGRDRGNRLSRGGEELALYRAATYGLVPRGTRIAKVHGMVGATLGERIRANRTAGSNPAHSATLSN